MVETGIQKNNSAQEKLIHSKTRSSLFYSQISQTAEIHNMSTFQLQPLVPQSGNFPNFSLSFSLKWSHCVGTAETMLSTEMVRSCKTHNHEAETQMKESRHCTAIISRRVFKKSICSHTPTYNRIFLDMNVSERTSQGPEIQPPHASPSTSTPPSAPFPFSPCVCQKN